MGLCEHSLGRHAYFSAEGKIALMVLKAYTAVSDSTLMAQAIIMRKLLTRERGTRLEGSFGTEKQYYSLDCIKARSRLTEILWIFFGIHTANAVRMISKKERYHAGAEEMAA